MTPEQKARVVAEELVCGHVARESIAHWTAGQKSDDLKDAIAAALVERHSGKGGGK